MRQFRAAWDKFSADRSSSRSSRLRCHFDLVRRKAIAACGRRGAGGAKLDWQSNLKIKTASVGGPRTETRDRNPFFRQENLTVGCSEALAGRDTRGDRGLIEATLALKNPVALR